MLTQYPEGFLIDQIEAYPETDFHFFCYMENAQGRLFTGQDADILFSTEPLQLPRMTPLAELHKPLRAFMADMNPLASRTRLTVEDLRDCYIITAGGDSAVRSQTVRRMEQAGVRASCYLSEAENALAAYLMKKRNAISFFAGPDDMLPPGTIAVPVDDSSFIWDLYVYRRNGHVAQAALQLVDAMLAFQKNEL